MARPINWLDTGGRERDRRMGTINTPVITKQERVYRAIRERILNGEYAPGDRVVVDALADEFKFSALPVREAIFRLGAEGLVVHRPNAGAHVAPADPELYAQDLIVFALLEGYATADAAPFLSDEEVEQLREINRRMATAVDCLDRLSFVNLNQEFHDTIYKRCTNSVIVDLLRVTTKRLEAIRRNVFLHIPYRGAASVVEHNELIELIATNAPMNQIEAKARAHKMHALENFRAWQRDGEHSGVPPRADDI
jgi:DNA-binding GntR family transcriptional regulator